MPKILPLILLALFVLVLPGTALTQTAIPPTAGDGSEGDPYLIATLENLYWIAALNDTVPSPTQAQRWAAHYK